MTFFEYTAFGGLSLSLLALGFYMLRFERERNKREDLEHENTTLLHKQEVNLHANEILDQAHKNRPARVGTTVDHNSPWAGVRQEN